jgi:hypothetical protein
MPREGAKDGKIVEENVLKVMVDEYPSLPHEVWGIVPERTVACNWRADITESP